MKDIMNEQLSLNQGSPIRARKTVYSSFKYPWHFHSDYEIIYILESHGYRFVGDSMEPFAPGDLVLLGSNLPHYMRSAPELYENNQEQNVKAIIIQFAHDFMAHSIQSYPELTNVKKLLERSERGIHFPMPENKYLIPLIEQLPQLNGLDRFVGVLNLLEAMSLSDNQKLIGSALFTNELSVTGDSRIEKSIRFLNRNYQKDIKLKDLSILVAMNHSSFCRYFKNKTGKTLLEYIYDLRIGYACKLLLENKLDVIQISIECGFNNISHFNRIFKRITDLTPLGYRTQFLK